MDSKIISRYSILPGESPFKSQRLGEWMRVEEVEAVFTPGVAYMPVPRCEQCAHWARMPSSFFGNCARVEEDGNLLAVEGGSFESCEDFGCVQWKEKQ